MFWAKLTRMMFSWGRLIGAASGRLGDRLRRRVPVVRQLSATECGAACLSMILGHYGRKTRVAECRRAVGAGRDGVTALTIARAAREHGLRVKAYSLNPTDFGFIQLPAIVHWNFNHFVVVERWSAAQVEIVDPASGRFTLTPEEFRTGFTGVVMMFEPGPDFRPGAASARPRWRGYFLKYILRFPRLLLQVAAASVLLQALGLLFPLFTKIVVDYVLPSRAPNVLLICGAGMVLFIIAQVVTGYIRATLLLYLQARLDSRMMLDFLGHLLSLPFKFFQQRTSGDLLMRLGSNAVIREMLTSQTLSVMLDGSLVILYLFILLTQSPALGLIALTVGGLQVALLLATAGRVQQLMQRDLAAQSESQSYLVEALTRIETIKSFGAEDRALAHWSGLFFKQLNVSLRRSRLSALIDTGMMTLRALAPLFLLWFGVHRVLDGTMSLGTMLALNALAAAFLSPLSSLVSSGQRLQLAGSHLDRIADVLEADPEQDPAAVRDAPALTGRVELKGVGFRYDAEAPEVLRDISLSVEPGQKVALVGRTGSGKSTLGKLLLGLYAPTAGEITYDGVPLQGMNYRALRSQFGVVLQESLLFSGSIRRNITFDDPSLPSERVREAARLAAIHDDIERMPMGYETPVSEGNSGLAGGQCQRLSLARALARRPVLLLLDEATSHLDALTERQVDENLSGLSCTRVVIAHRLSTIVNADLILVLDGGRVVERGTHEELLARAGVYAALVSAQMEPERVRAVA